MVFFLFVVIFKKFTLPCPGIELNVTLVTHNETCEESYISFNSKTIYALPTILFAYVCHPSVLPIYSELKDRSIKKMEAVSKVSFFSMFVMYLLTAVFGYLTFYSYVNDQLLHTYSRHDDILILIVRLAVFTAVILTVPVLFFVVRSSALELMKQKQFKWSLHIGVTFILLALCVLLVIFIPSIKDIFAVIGATSANMLIFILPAAIYLKLNDSLPFKKRIMPILFLTAGVISALITVPLVIIDWVHTVQNNETTAH
ncbi:S38A1 protein, partial [Amia calva]|nr:S38A1 protein [Amia calva]